MCCSNWEACRKSGGPSGAARYPVLADLDAEIARVDRVLLSTEPFRFRDAHARDLAARLYGLLVSRASEQPDATIGSVLGIDASGEMLGRAASQARPGLRFNG